VLARLRLVDLLQHKPRFVVRNLRCERPEGSEVSEERIAERFAPERGEGLRVRAIHREREPRHHADHLLLQHRTGRPTACRSYIRARRMPSSANASAWLP